MTDNEIPHSKYNVTIVEAVLLKMAVELHPRHLTARNLSLRIISNPDDRKEIETAARAIRGLRGVGLLTERDDATVEPTPAARRACELLA
jgi:hypothetical protein